MLSNKIINLKREKQNILCYEQNYFLFEGLKLCDKVIDFGGDAMLLKTSTRAQISART